MLKRPMMTPEAGERREYQRNEGDMAEGDVAVVVDDIEGGTEVWGV
jgi:hypothetical protein